ncbi:hypothetical protein Tco_1117097, partial [Tanacetum coccineum]
FRSTYPGRHVAWESYPQRQVAQETPNLSLGIVENVVVREIKALLREKHSLQHEANKLAKRAKELELEFDETKGIKTKEVVEPCLSCEKLTHVVDSLKNDLSKLQDEALGFSKFKKNSDTINHMFCQQKVSQDKEGQSKNLFPKSKPSSQRIYYKYNKFHYNLGHNLLYRRDNSDPNQTFPHSQNMHLLIFSKFSLKTLCILLQDPRMYNLEMFYANLNGPKR